VLALRDTYERFVRSTFESAQTAGLIRGDVPAKYLGLALMSVLNHAALWFRKDQALLEQQLAEVLTKMTARFSLTMPDLEPEVKKLKDPLDRLRTMICSHIESLLRDRKGFRLRSRKCRPYRTSAWRRCRRRTSGVLRDDIEAK
jgi:hypothetical protein